MERIISGVMEPPFIAAEAANYPGAVSPRPIQTDRCKSPLAAARLSRVSPLWGTGVRLHCGLMMSAPLIRRRAQDVRRTAKVAAELEPALRRATALCRIARQQTAKRRVCDLHLSAQEVRAAATSVARGSKAP